MFGFAKLSKVVGERKCHSILGRNMKSHDVRVFRFTVAQCYIDTILRPKSDETESRSSPAICPFMALSNVLPSSSEAKA